MREFQKEKVPIPANFQPLVIDPALPLDIEIGCGVGFHPLRYARENPGRQLIAFERTEEKFDKFARRIKNHPPFLNLMAIHGDALNWIVHGIKPLTVDRYIILYPNPYPKEKQKNQRFHEMPFMGYLIETLKRKGQIVLATNIESYAIQAKEKFIHTWQLKLFEESRVEKNTSPRTHFEKKYLERGEVCWNLVFEK